MIRCKAGLAKSLVMLLPLLLISACSDGGAKETGTPGANTPPFFTADQFGTGPLSIAELNIHIPAELDKDLSDSDRACIFEAVERRANEAGDPTNLDPNKFPYWGGKVDQKEWAQHSNHMRRVLLAQAIISWAMIDC